MRRTDTVTKLLSILLFAALIAYLGVYIARALREDIQTSLAVESTVSETALARGILLREELLLTAPGGFLEFAAESGKAVARQAVVAYVCSDAGELDALHRLREAENALALARTYLDAEALYENPARRAEHLRGQLLSLRASVTEGDLIGAGNAAMETEVLLFGAEGSTVTREAVARLEAEVYSLRGTVSSGSTALSAPVSGIFSAATDGYEHLSPALLDGLTAKALDSLMNSEAVKAENSAGKIVSSHTWYYAALLNEADARRLTPGAEISLQLQRSHPAPLLMRVESVSEAEEGRCAVVFSCSRALAETLSLRQATALLTFRELSGIRIPAEALRTDENGAAYVYTVTGTQAERKNVMVVYEGDTFYLVTSSGADALRAGNEIIVSGEDLFDGKVLG